MARRIHSSVVAVLFGWMVCAGYAGFAAGDEPVLALRVPQPAISQPAQASLSESAAATEDLTAAGAAVDGSGEIEMVTERYPDGSVKIQREVTLDDQCNYVNHGSYTMYDRSGNVIRSGKFRMGQMQGVWTQTFAAGEGDLFSGELNEEFTGPFTSEATFEGGQLHGTWTITDGAGQKIIEWRFEHGVRHGLATWWYPNGKQRWEATYENGLAQDDFQQWNRDGSLARTIHFIDGRPLVKQVKWHSKTQKAFEGAVLAAQDLTQPEFDWWTTSSSVAPATTKVPELKHGLWTAWHPNGQKKVEGEYREGVPVGKFAWWYENGQVQARGTFEEGMETGTWITWHSNGMKESVGEYTGGQITGKWMRWQPDGKLVEIHDFSLQPKDEQEFTLDLEEPSGEAPRTMPSDEAGEGETPIDAPAEFEGADSDMWQDPFDNGQAAAGELVPIAR